MWEFDLSWTGGCDEETKRKYANIHAFDAQRHQSRPSLARQRETCNTNKHIYIDKYDVIFFYKYVSLTASWFHWKMPLNPLPLRKENRELLAVSRLSLLADEAEAELDDVDDDVTPAEVDEGWPLFVWWTCAGERECSLRERSATQTVARRNKKFVNKYLKSRES